MTTLDSTAAWQGILDPKEKILWQGRPDGAVSLRAGNVALMLFGLAFAGFALFWMIMASMAGGGFWMFGLIHFTVGIGIIVGAIYGGPYVRRRTWYTLTDARAFVAKDIPLRGRSLDSYPITPETVLELTGDHLPSIWFAQKRVRTKNGSRIRKIGFERLHDAQPVYALLRQIQRGDTPG